MKHRLLILDEKEALFAAGESFLAEGHEVDCARELEEAGALLASVRYSLVIAHLGLGGLRGAQELQALAEGRERSPGTRVLVVASGDEEDLRGLDVEAVLRPPLSLLQVAEAALGLLGDRP